MHLRPKIAGHWVVVLVSRVSRQSLPGGLLGGLLVVLVLAVVVALVVVILVILVVVVLFLCLGTHFAPQPYAAASLVFGSVFSSGPRALGYLQQSYGPVLIVYVDDLAFLRPVEICRAFIETVQAKWRTSDPEWLGADPVNLLRSGANPARGGSGNPGNHRDVVVAFDKDTTVEVFNTTTVVECRTRLLAISMVALGHKVGPDAFTPLLLSEHQMTSSIVDRPVTQIRRFIAKEFCRQIRPFREKLAAQLDSQLKKAGRAKRLSIASPKKQKVWVFTGACLRVYSFG
ncbi:hypothetical protein AK812_SmicGene31242 [Symbiodinium microadriaticum]|uniref:Uncharacterized protein n=1 Tax=Symbiodinium microadriaticum TaxID=2951 RepID=A0A1Q9CX69_SYMMI|nr:hypothetical protein AK812_SmicGene31242 [Symbiodinium microadriaticum]